MGRSIARGAKFLRSTGGGHVRGMRERLEIATLTIAHVSLGPLFFELSNTSLNL